MGSASKIILIGATSLIVGIYAVSLKKVQTNDINTALVEMKRVQFERVQAAAIRTAIDKFISAPYYGSYDISSSRFQLGNDTTFTYSFTGTDPGVSSSLQVTVYQRNQYNVFVPRIITATVTNTSSGGVKQGPRRIHRGTWQVTKYYVNRES
jgi:hypothetical protein